MSAITGANGEFRYLGRRVAKCRNFSIDISRDALETTGVGDRDRTYVEGIRNTSGSATLIYDETDGATTGLLNSILTGSGSATREITLVLNTATNRSFTCEAILTQVGTPVSVGEVTACSVSFQVSGGLEGAF